MTGHVDIGGLARETVPAPLLERFRDARHVLAVSPVAWLLSLPYAVEILGQTRVDAHSWTEVGTTAIYYKDWETHRVRRSFTCQFHPELKSRPNRPHPLFTAFIGAALRHSHPGPVPVAPSALAGAR